MRRVRPMAVMAAALLALAGCTAGTGGEQALVDRAALTVQEIMTQTVSQDPRDLLTRARGVLVCPRVFKAGFFFGGEGGSCVLLARAGNGSWSYPTFYDIGSASFGFQFGIQDSELLLLVMTDKGLNALMDSQIRLGGNLSVAVASVGAGVGGATTTAIGPDIVAFAATRGLFGGVSLDGGVMSARVDENQAYYGQPLGARQIVRQMQGSNPGADPLREVLMRFGAGGAPAQANGPPPGQGYGAAPSYPPSNQGYAAPPASNPPPGQNYGAQPQSYPPPAQSSQPPPRPTAPAYTSAPPPQTPGGYQPPPGQYTYPPQPAGNSPIQQQQLPPPAR